MEWKMKENIWKKSFVAGPYKIKDLSLANQLELSILTEELGKYWTMVDGNVQIDIEGVKDAMKTGELKDILTRSGELLQDILDDVDFESMNVYEIFMLIPVIQWEVKKYKEALKKK